MESQERLKKSLRVKEAWEGVESKVRDKMRVVNGCFMGEFFC